MFCWAIRVVRLPLALRLEKVKFIHNYKSTDTWSRERYRTISEKKKRSFALPESVKKHYFNLVFKKNCSDKSGFNTIQDRMKINTMHISLTKHALINMTDIASKERDMIPANLSDFELIKSIKSFKANSNIMVNLEDECCSRLSLWDTNTILEIAESFYENDYFATQYYTRMISTVDARWSQMNLTEAQILQLLFFIMCLGDSPEQLMLKIENAIETSSFTQEQVSLICLTFFLSNRRLKSHKLLLNLSDSVKSSINSYSSQALNNVLKAFRHASHVSPMFCDIVGNHLMITHMRLSPVDYFIKIMEASRYYSSIRYHHVKFINTLCLKLRDIQPPLDIRSKDFTQLMMCIAHFGQKLDSDSIRLCCDQLNSFKLEGQFSLYPEALVTGLTALAIMGHYPESLISFCFSKQNIHTINSLPHIDKNYQLLLLYVAAMIERSDVRFVLPKGFLESFPEHVLGVVSHEICTRTGLDRVIDSLRERYGADYVQCHCVLPCFQTASVELCLNENGTAYPLTYDSSRYNLLDRIQHLRDRLTSPDASTIRGGHVAFTSDLYDRLVGARNTEPAEDPQRREHGKLARQIKVAIELVGYHQCAINTSDYQGLTLLKHRLLRHLGYDVIVLNPDEGKRFHEMSNSQVLASLQPKIDAVVNNRNNSNNM